MSILADTNILLRRTQPDHPSHTLAVESVAKLLATPEPVYFTLQNISEFWSVATRPIASNGLGFSVALTLVELDKIEQFLSVLPDSHRSLCGMEALGGPANDTKLVATMNVHGIRGILTFNTDDLARYDVEAIHPLSLLS